MSRLSSLINPLTFHSRSYPNWLSAKESREKDQPFTAPTYMPLTKYFCKNG